jgi:hypothetical protein
MKTAFTGRMVRVIAGFGAIGAISAGGGGCENRHLLGGIDDGDASTPPHLLDAGMSEPVMVSPVDARPDVGFMPDQTWTGYVENFSFLSGSDAIKLAFSVESSGQLVGTVTLGSGTPPPPATEPNVGYPAEFSPFGLFGAREYIAEGYPYSMRDGTLSGARLRFSIGTLELWTDWCALQTPAPATGQCDEPVCSSLCLPNQGYMMSLNGRCALWNPATGQYDKPVDCGKAALCLGDLICRCDPSACSVIDDVGHIRFDITVNAADASGSAVGGQIVDRNVHFTRAP